MSKIINKFEKMQLITRHTCATDNRNMDIHMTQKGMSVFHELNNHANEQIENLIANLNAADCEKLINSIRTVKKYSHVFLWTVSAQESARILYKKAGFIITETSKNENWGNPVLEEKWELDL